MKKNNPAPKESKKKQTKETSEAVPAEEKKNPYHNEYGLFSNMRYVLHFVKLDSRSTLTIFWIATLIAPVYQYLWTFLSKFVIDAITGDGQNNRLLIVILVFFILQLVATMLKTLVNTEMGWRPLLVRMKMILRLNKKAMTIDFQNLEDPDVMDCYQKANECVGSDDRGFQAMVAETRGFLETLTIVLVGMIIIGTLNVYLTILMLILAVLNFTVSNKVNKTAKKVVWDPLAPWWRKSDYMVNASSDFSFAKDIRMFNLKGWLLSKHREVNTVRKDAAVKNTRLWSIYIVVSQVLWIVCQALTYIYLISCIVRGKMSIGNFSMYLTSAATFFNFFNNLLDRVSGFLARSREIDDLRSFIDLDKEIDENEGLPVPDLDRYEFTFENVSFQYPRSEHYALKNLNLTVRAGQRLAVVGLNGAGKTTMIKLLLRLYEPTEGRILLNGVDIKTYNKTAYYKIFAPVFQEIRMFAFPLSQNVSMQDETATDVARAEACIREAGLSEKLDTLPNGIQTQMLKVIYDDGIDLSGGEKQKLALARALYKNAPVVVLDEPTSALDALAEAKLYEDFDKMIGGKTAIYISHRLSSTRFCSAVAMFADGEMKEYGTHDELLAKNGAYAELFRVQAQYYLENGEQDENNANGQEVTDHE